MPNYKGVEMSLEQKAAHEALDLAMRSQDEAVEICDMMRGHLHIHEAALGRDDPDIKLWRSHMAKAMWMTRKRRWWLRRPQRAG